VWFVPSVARVALGSFALAAVLLIGGAAPAFSSRAALGSGGISVKLLQPLSRRAPPSAAVPYAAPLRVANAALYRKQKAAAVRRYELWRQRRGLAPATFSAAGPLTSVFNGLDQPGITDAADPVLGGTPSDSTGAIGPSNYVEFINSEIAVYSSTNLSTPTSTLDANTFVAAALGTSTCDIQIQWDQEGQRWLYSALDCAADPGAEGFYFGWSKTADPAPLDSNWCRYQASTGTSFEDYPKLGHDDSQIIVGTNAFADDGVGDYTASHIFVFDKPVNGVTTCPTGASEESTVLEASTNAVDFTPVPANIADDSATGYVVSARSFSDQAHIDLYTIGRNAAGANAVLGTTAVTVPAFDVPAPVPQPGGTDDALDSLDTRLTQAVAFTDPATGKEGVWTQHTIDGGGPSVVRWYELTPGDTTPTRSGTVSGPDGAFAFNGAISPAENGSSAVLTYNSGSSTQLVDWRAQDPLASTVDDIRLATSSDVDEDFSCGDGMSAPPCRWGDYAGASPDPANPCVAWGTSMLTVTAPDVAGDPQWGTQNAAIDTSSGTCQTTAGVVRTGSGSGTVTSTPGGIDCGSTCTHSYDVGAPVTLTATPAAGSTFGGWSGACAGTGVCFLTMDKARSVVATFTGTPQTLSVTRSGSGSGTVASSPAGLNCGATCSTDFDYGTSVTLTATAATGSTFSGWSGDCSGVGTCTVTMTQARSVTATFSLLPMTLTVSRSGSGSGTVTSSPLGIACGSICSRNFLFGTSVSLTATPSAGSVFSGWSEACSGHGSCTVAMTKARSVTAKFTKLACHVPRLRGKKLKAAKRALRKAHCKAGKITRKHSEVVKKGRVISQRPKPGKHLKKGAKVKLVISKGKKP
jgi:hypothetical protein